MKTASYQNFLQQIQSGKITTDKQRVYQEIKAIRILHSGNFAKL